MIKITNSPTNGFQRYFLIGLLLILLVLLAIFVSPFAIDLLIAGIMVAAVYPVHRWIFRKIPFSRSLSALVSMLLIIIVILLPFTLFGFFVADQAADAYVVVSNHINVIVDADDAGRTSKILELIPFSERVISIFQYLPISTSDILRTAGDAVGMVSSFLISKTTNILRHFLIFLVHLMVFMIALFYFLRDGDRLALYIRSLIPLSKKYRQELFTKLSNLSYGIIYGIFGAAIAQGLLVGIGFSTAGISNAAFWGAIAALFSPVPFIGTTVVWLPAVIFLAINGQYLTAVLLLAWCALIVGMADNVIKPYIIGSSAQLHPLATLLVLLGGTFVFGLKGLIFGPLVLTLAIAFLHIYKLEYKSVLEQDEKNLIPKHTVKKRKIRK